MVSRCARSLISLRPPKCHAVFSDLDVYIFDSLLTNRMCFVTGWSQIAFRGNSPSYAPVLQTANLENVLIAEDPLSTLLTLSTLLPLRSPRRLLPRRRHPAPPHASEVHASEVHASEVHAAASTRPGHATHHASGRA